MELIHYGDVLDQDIQRLPTRKPAPAMGKMSVELSSKLRDHAIMSLLVEDWIEGFSGNLVRSGVSRLIFLEQTADSGADNPYRCATFFDPLLDALAGGDLQLAARLAKATAEEPLCGDPHDFYYAQTIQRLLQGAPPSDLLASIQAFTGAADKEDARLQVCRAMIDGSDSAFHTAFEHLLDREQSARGKYSEWEFAVFEKDFSEFGGFDAVMEVHNGIRTDDEDLEAFDDLEGRVRRAGRQVFIEGLALLQLAENRGLRTREDYRYCPARVRHIANTSFDWAQFVNQVPRSSTAR